MPAIYERKIRMVNPGKRKLKNASRKMSLKQLLHFGSKRQRANAAKRLHNKRTRKRNVVYRGKDSRYAKGHYKYSANRGGRRRKPNVGHILTVLPSIASNPGRRRKRRSNKGRTKTMARATRKQLRALAKARAARKRYAHGGRKRRSSNPRRRRHHVVHHRRRSYPVARRRRSMNPRRRRHYNVRHRRYRRNPDFTSGQTGRVLGVIGGATLTKILVGFVPSQFTTGLLGYVAIGLVAWLQGRAVGKVMKNGVLGNDFTTGGFVYLAIKVLNDFLPSLGGNLGLAGGRGMGLIAPSSFYLPQVNLGNSMGQFVRPAAVPAPYIPPASGVMSGMGSVRRGGRVR